MSAPPFFPGQPGYEDDDPQADRTTQALFNACDALRAAALFADDPDEETAVNEMLGAAEMIKFGFPPGTDEAKGLHLLIGSIRRAAAEVAS
jgi:hypothetical protein